MCFIQGLCKSPVLVEDDEKGPDVLAIDGQPEKGIEMVDGKLAQNPVFTGLVSQSKMAQALRNGAGQFRHPRAGRP